ncbi:MAG: YeeE/YedE family protein [Burkholderiaceae bacterium]|nr:YeeE/YedE family protein [Burkholderiaceae bacterium]
MKTAYSAALVLLGALPLAAQWLQGQPGGRTLAFALGVGALLGLVLQRSRFCFYCHARDWFEDDNPRGLLAIVLALAVGTLGMTVVLGSWVPVPEPGKLPPDMHIGPVSGVLVAAGLAFGAGMVVSGSCISAHWYRLAEGSAVSPFALLGSALGFILGFKTWNPLYSAAVADAPVVWLPAHLGYGGALLLQWAVLAALAAWLWRGFAREKFPPGAPAAGGQPGVPSLGVAWQRLWTGRWNYWVGGLAVGAIAALVIVRMRPLGVTATLGSAARQGAQAAGWIPERLDGLDGFAGCATTPQATWLTPNAMVLAGLVAGAFIAALASRQCTLRWPTWRDAVRGLVGGVLLGWGAMTGLGCTVGTLLSGTMAGALSGWVFGASLFTAVWLGLKVKARWAR